MKFEQIEQLKEVLKDLFESGQIRIETDIEPDYHHKDMVTRVYIDDKKVAEHRERL